MRFILINVLAVFVLSSCATVRTHEMEKSLAAYKSCLSQHPKNTKACESERLIYEADKSALMATKSGLLGLGGSDNSVNKSDSYSGKNESSHWMMNKDGRTYMCNNIGGTVNCH